MAMTIRTMTSLMGAAALTWTATIAVAQEWAPIKPIQMVIMAGPGGGADQIARFLQGAAEQQDVTPRPLVPENRPGGSGAESFLALQDTPDPDHTIMVTLNSFYTTPLRQPGLGVDISEYAPIARMAEDPFVLWVHADSGITSFEQFLEEAGAAGNGWVMGGTGRAQEDELVTDFLNTTFDLDMRYIPYEGGGEVARQLAGQQVNSTVNNPAEALGFYESGDAVPLVVFSEERLDLFPEVPTLIELGTDFAYNNQRSVVGAPGMSEEALAFYSNMFEEIYNSEDWQGYMESQAMVGEYLTGPDLMEYWDTNLARHETMLQEGAAAN